MKSRDFCYWLQGFFELAEQQPMTTSQVACVRAHLALVFKHEIDPSIDGGDPKVKPVLDAIHHGRPPNQDRPSGPIRC